MRKLAFSLSASLLISTSAFANVEEGLELLNTGDLAGAAEQFASAYDAGDGEGAFYLGRLFELGLGAEQDEARAANLYAAAAEAGSAKAKLRLGLIYHEGRVLLRDYAEGTKLICEAAEAGEAEGLLNCGLAYQQGVGVEPDAEMALDYYEQAVAQENIAAMNVLAGYYIEQEQLDEAMTYAKMAADAGNALGMLRYAEIMAAGETPNRIEAYAFTNLAIVRGLNEASGLRDTLEAQMSPSEVLQGQQFAKDWTEAQIQTLSN